MGDANKHASSDNQSAESGLDNVNNNKNKSKRSKSETLPEVIASLITNPRPGSGEKTKQQKNELNPNVVPFSPGNHDSEINLMPATSSTYPVQLGLVQAALFQTV